MPLLLLQIIKILLLCVNIIEYRLSNIVTKLRELGLVSSVLSYTLPYIQCSVIGKDKI